MSFESAHTGRFVYAATSFTAFLVLEPFKPEILSHFATGLSQGWIAFTSLRLFLLLSAVICFIFALREHESSPPLTVPMPLEGNDPLLTLRAVAFMMVAAGHGMVVVFPPADIDELLKEGSNAWLLMGSPWAGVWVFFVLSGYLMAKGFYRGKYDLSRQQLMAFYKSRILRIAPIYYFVLFITALFACPDIFLKSNWWEIAALAVFSQQNGAPHPIVAALWSVQTEMAFYAAVPMLFFLMKKITSRYPIWLVAGALLALGWGYRSYVIQVTDGSGWLERVYVPLIGNLDLFLLGMCANWALPVARRWLRSLPTLSIGLAALVALYLAATYYFSQATHGANAEYYRSAIQICGPSLVGFTTFLIIILFEHHARTKNKANLVSQQIVRQSQTLGILTYCLYVWHEPVFLYLRTLANAHLTLTDSISWVSLAFAITAIISFLTNKWLEAPFSARKSLAATTAKIKAPRDMF